VPRRMLAVCAGVVAGLWSLALPAQDAKPPLASLIVDDTSAELTGTWKASTHTAGFVGAGYQHATGPGVHTATFKVNVPSEGEYRLLVGHTPGTNRSKNAAITITTTDGEQTLRVNQQNAPEGPLGLHVVGKYRFATGETKVIFSPKIPPAS
jgi:hypothetical protein